MDTLLKIATVLFILLEVVVIFNLLILVHELGHFLAARWRGLKIEQFGIWFGKPLWQKTVNGVVYSLGSIPAGGFVKLPQLAPMDIIEGTVDEPRETLPPIGVLDKIIVAAAGPLFSLGLAFVFATLVWGIGRPVGEAETSTRVGYVQDDSPAQGILEPGDRIISIDGQPVKKFSGMGKSVAWYVVRSEGDTLRMEIERDGQMQTVQVTPRIPEKKRWWQRAGVRQILIEPAATPMVAGVEKGSGAEKAGLQRNDLLLAIAGEPILHYSEILDYPAEHPGEPVPLTVERDKQIIETKLALPPSTVGEVFPGSPADRAGLQKDDRVLSVNGESTGSPMQVGDLIERAGGQPVTLAVQRGGETLTKQIQPQTPKGGDRPMIGLAWAQSMGGLQLFDGGKTAMAWPNPVHQVVDSVSNMVQTLGALFSPKSHIKAQHMSGPVMIMRIYYMLFEAEQGWRLVLWFSVFLNVNLALLNLLPIPVLDGGHIVLAIIEGIRRRPVSIRILEKVQGACAILLIGYMLYVTFFDVQDLPWGRRDRLEFTPPSEQAR